MTKDTHTAISLKDSITRHLIETTPEGGGDAVKDEGDGGQQADDGWGINLRGLW